MNIQSVLYEESCVTDVQKGGKFELGKLQLSRHCNTLLCAFHWPPASGAVLCAAVKATLTRRYIPLILQFRFIGCKCVGTWWVGCDDPTINKPVLMNEHCFLHKL